MRTILIGGGNQSRESVKEGRRQSCKPDRNRLRPRSGGVVSALCEGCEQSGLVNAVKFRVFRVLVVLLSNIVGEYHDGVWPLVCSA